VANDVMAQRYEAQGWAVIRRSALRTDQQRFPRSGDNEFTSLGGRSADSGVDQALIAFDVTKELCEDIL
jgi:hypothetical protein